MTGMRKIKWPVTIVIDTREKLDWQFDYLPVVGPTTAFSRTDVVLFAPTIKAKLTDGDYSVQGLETRVSVERKSLSDLFQTLGNSTRRTRFSNHLRRMHESYDWCAVVVEATPTKIRQGLWSSTISGKQCLAIAGNLARRWSRVKWFYEDGRRAAEIAAWTFLCEASERYDSILSTDDDAELAFWCSKCDDFCDPCSDCRSCEQCCGCWALDCETLTT